MSFSARVVLWFVCLLFGATCLGFIYGGGMALVPVTGLALVYALPVWCLYLLLVKRFEDAEGRRGWILLFTGIVIGPACFALLGLGAMAAGIPNNQIWPGSDPEQMGTAFCMLLALVVGTLATVPYVLVLKLMHRRFRS